MTIAIIADDLTGANDSGLQFASFGLPTTVFLGEPTEGLPEDSQVAVIDTETRGLEAADVPPMIETVARKLRSAGARHVYKKIDSTMRGHVGLELAVAARAIEAGHIFLTPAFPAMRRTVVSGELLVDGVPVAQTPLARDPGSPVTESNLVRMLSPHMPDTLCLSVTRQDLTEAPEALIGRLRDARAAGRTTCVVFDAETDEDLTRIARFGADYAQRDGETVLWAGSAGLAAHLPQAWGFQVPPGHLKVLRPATRPPLLVVGSVNPTSIAQLETAARTLQTDPVALCPDALLGTPEERDREIARGVDALRALARAKTAPLILTTAHAAEDVERIVALATAKGITRGDAGRRIATGLAQVAQTLLDEGTVNRLVTTGGDTGRAIMDASGIRAMSVDGAVAPGIPLITTRNGPRRHIVTKAGGFGAPDALVTAMAFLTEGRLSS